MKAPLLLITFASLFLSTTLFASQKHFAKNLCPESGYDCVKVKRGDTWYNLFPNPRERDLVMRLNRTNIPLQYHSWIVVPNNLSQLDLMDVSPFPEKIQEPGERTIIVSLKKQAFAAYNQYGYLVHWGPVSGAKGYCPDIGRSCTTATGKFRVIRKGDMDCKSTKYPVGKGGSPMPFCMFFYRGFALHGSTLPGYHASHGCIRLFFEDAEWLNKGFISAGGSGTQVIVTNS